MSRLRTILEFEPIIIFSDPEVDTRFVVELAGASQIKPFDPFCSIFKTNIYRVDQQRYCVCHTQALAPAGHPFERSMF
jgi:hypothetical protein